MIEELNKIIHEELLPLRQAFLSYEQLSHNPSMRVDPKIFRKCAVKIDKLIIIARELA